MSSPSPYPASIAASTPGVGNAGSDEAGGAETNGVVVRSMRGTSSMPPSLHWLIFYTRSESAVQLR